MERAVEVVLEVPPKWELLKQVLEEVHEERGGLSGGEGGDRHGCLVVVRHYSTAQQLRRWLMPEEMGGGRLMMAELWEDYLQTWAKQVWPPLVPVPPFPESAVCHTRCPGPSHLPPVRVPSCAPHVLAASSDPPMSSPCYSFPLPSSRCLFAAPLFLLPLPSR